MKRPGYCTLCEKPVFEFTGDKPSRPHDDAWRVNFLLSDDTSADITFCAGCLEVLPEETGRVWEICLDAFDNDEKDRPTNDQKSGFLVHIHEQHLVRELSRVRWTELI